MFKKWGKKRENHEKKAKRKKGEIKKHRKKNSVIGIGYVHGLYSLFVNSSPTWFIRACSLYFEVWSVGELQGFLVF